MAAAALLSLSPSFSPPSTCSDAVVGGGWSGVYFLYRRALAAAKQLHKQLHRRFPLKE